jgi:insertion element IS1 protein InsB
VRLICTDAYNVYDQAYKPGKHYVGKDQTYRIEQNNGRQRHWFARFRRKSIVVSKSLEMIELTIALFAAFHINKTANFCASLIC